jgi:hypothetical protein
MLNYLSNTPLARRSWNLPKGVCFAPYRREFRYAGERHRRVVRMWRIWLEAAYPGIAIWECWKKVPLQKGIPDALAWGKHRGRELLFWLEVDRGHSSREIMHRNYRDRVWTAYLHAKEWLGNTDCFLHHGTALGGGGIPVLHFPHFTKPGHDRTCLAGIWNIAGLWVWSMA